MDIFSMQCFLSAAENLNLSKAAMQMHITQPAMSIQIKKLEQEIGMPLFERTSRKLVLTPAGQIVQKSFQSIIGTYQTMLWQTQTIKQETPCLRIGYHGPVNWAGIQGLFQTFLRENTDIRIAIRTGELGELARQVEEGQLDIAFLEASDYGNQEDMAWEWLFDDYSCFAMSEKHPLATHPVISGEDLQGQNVYFNMRNSASMQGIFHKLIQSGIDSDQLICVDGTATSIAFAVAYGGLAALPMTFKEEHKDGVVYIDHASSVVHMQYGLGWRRDNETEALRKFIACAKAYIWPKPTIY